LLFLALLVVCALAFGGCASAAELPVTTNQSGTVSGDLYVNATQPTPFNEQPQDVGVTQEASFNFAPSGYTNVTYAKFYSMVYVAGTDSRECVVNVALDGDNDGVYETLLEDGTILKRSSSGDGTVHWQNDHISRVYSDYFLEYDVTPYIKSGTVRAKVQTAPGSSSMDGRIKYLALVVAYDDGDNDRVQYWVNDGHQWFSSGESRQTSFNTTSLTSGWDSAELRVVHSSTTDASYSFNGATKIGNNPPVATYFMVNTWNVTEDLTPGASSTLIYTHSQGASCKITISTLKVHYPASSDDRADLVAEILTGPSSLVVNQTYQVQAKLANYGNSPAGNFLVKLYDNDQEVGSQGIGSLDEGSSLSLTFNWRPVTTGSHTLRLVVDSAGEVDESDESNNQLSRFFTVKPAQADLTVTGLTVPSDPVVNQTYQVEGVIRNQGLVSAGAFQVELYDGSTLLGSQTVNGLGVGDAATIQFNWRPVTTGGHTLRLVVDSAGEVDESDESNNEYTRYLILNEAGVVRVFIISDNPGTNIVNQAAHEIMDMLGGAVSIQPRSNTQVEAMTEDQLLEYLNRCDIFIGEWISTNAATLLSKVLTTHPMVANKPNGVFLILEPPVSTISTSVELMKYSNIRGVRILDGFTNDQLLDFYKNTLRGSNYTAMMDYLSTVNFPLDYETATQYKNLNDKDNLKNQILWALNLIGVESSYQAPTLSSEKEEYGIYRYRWYTLSDYMATYFEGTRKGTVGVIESTMYVDSQMLQTYYGIIDSLEAQGLNVIPVMAYGATTAQLNIMVQAFTNAPDYATFMANPEQYTVYVDSIVEMAAYGLGGESFNDVINFFKVLNVPVIRAIHSDVITNEEWELESTGLPTADGSKWWHISILEAQGIIEYNFVGGKATTVDPKTGAAILGYTPQEGNIDYMTRRVASWVKLKYLPNADKLVSLIYYNYPPGKDNIGSSYMDTITSIYNLLLVLKAEGYTVENIPSNSTQLENLMITLGINVANWAPGELQKLANNPNIILYPVEDYQAWFNQLDPITRLQVVEGPVAYIGEFCRRAVQLDYTTGMVSRIDTWYSGVISLLPSDKASAALPILDNIVRSLKNYISTHKPGDYQAYLNYKDQFRDLYIRGMNGWGEAPGDIMVVEKNGKKYFVIPGMKFGKIFIGPEPQRGWEGDIAKLYHSSTVAPPHQYLAYFAYLQEQGTNAMVFMGRHATHEWLPGKELVLSPHDLPSVCVGRVPQVYYYIVDGLAEGIQAKRRGYAVIISHLTPPMTFTHLYGDLGTLATLASDYDGATSTQKPEIITKIRSLIQKNHYSLGADASTLSDEELINAVEDYLADIQSTLYPYGLHAIGQAWSEDEISLLVTSILSVDFAVSTTETTTLQEEISQVMYGKSYDNLAALDKDRVQAKCVEVVKALIYNEVDTVAAVLTTNPSPKLKAALEKAEYYITAIQESVQNEVRSLLNALNGGYIVPGAGGDPVANPDVLPTGSNFFHDQAAEIPTQEAYTYAKVLTLLALADLTQNTEKVALGIWCVETARDDGALVSVVLHLLGMKPVWSDSPSAGVNGKKMVEMPVYMELSDLVRPDGWSKRRIDVTIITSGLFRDLYSRQSQLLDNAFRVALARSYYTIINDANLKAKYGTRLNTALDPIMKDIGYYGVGYESLNDNYVAQHWVEDYAYYLSLNMTPEVAGEMAITRIFAPPEGDYGAGISKLVSESWTWDDRMELGEFYLKRMANMYSHKNWGTNNVAVFSRALTGISTIFTSRNTNLYGVLDNDDFFDYWGGLSMALEYVNGKAPTMYVLDYSNKAKPDSISLEQYMNRELTTRYYNPDWIRGMMNEGYSGARYMSNKFVKNLLGWQMTRPGSVQNWMWDKVADVYLRDSYNMGVTQFLSSGNNAYSMISLTGAMLTAAFEGYWTPDAATMNLVANTWAQMIAANGVACCDCSCANLAMMKWASSFVNTDLLAQLNAQFYEATQQAQFAPGETPTPTPNPQPGQPSPGSQGTTGTSSSESSSAGDAAGQEEESPSSASPGEEGESKAYEVNKSESSGGFSETGLPLIAVFGVLLLVGLVGLGYFRNSILGWFRK